MTGSHGVVHAFEIDPRLAERAARNFADLEQVRVYGRSGSKGRLPDSDVIYVSAGATAPQRDWLDALRSSGRLLFPLTDADGYGGVLMVTRRMTTRTGLWARSFAATFFLPWRLLHARALAMRKPEGGCRRRLRAGSPRMLIVAAGFGAR